MGAILESDNRLVLLPDHRPNGLSLPEVGRTGASGSASPAAYTAGEGTASTPRSISFAVFENPGSANSASITDRGEALLHARWPSRPGQLR